MKVTFHTQIMDVKNPLTVPDTARILTADPMSNGEYVRFTWIDEVHSPKPKSAPRRATVAKELKQRDARSER